jgi:phosphatidylserine/phosphatidylglycerophosphate/cardiolipin synthase-like enzyme
MDNEGPVLPLPNLSEGEGLFCPICGVHYLPTEDIDSVYSHFKNDWHYSIKNKDLINHSRQLALIASNFDRLPPLRSLFRALHEAKEFVHFATYGIHEIIIGALKMAAQSVSVHGIVSNVDTVLMKELQGFKEEAPSLVVKTYGTRSSWRDMPHQKFVIIDGLLAFKGSANLTISGWRKAGKGRDILEVVTNVDKIIELNNRYFSPIWAELSDIEDVVEVKFRF